MPIAHATLARIAACKPVNGAPAWHALYRLAPGCAFNVVTNDAGQPIAYATKAAARAAADYVGASCRVVGSPRFDAATIDRTSALTAQQPAQQQQADASAEAEPRTLAPAIEAVARAGFTVYMRAKQGMRRGGDTWLHFTDGKQIGYLQKSDFGGYSLSTVHVANTTSGTGYGIVEGLDAADLDARTLAEAFVTAPAWADSRSRASVRKWADWATFAKSNAWADYVRAAGPVEAPAMVPMPAQQQQADAGRFNDTVHAEAASWLAYVAACAETAPSVADFDAAVIAAVEGLLARHAITPRVADCLLTFFDTPREPVVAAIVPAAVAMVPMPAQQQQARHAAIGQPGARRGMARSEGDGTWQAGIYNLARNDAGAWVVAATGPGTIGGGYIGTYASWAEAYTAATGEPAPGTRMVPMPAQQQQACARHAPITGEITLPAYWAAYLINGDASGLNDGEAEQCDAHLALRLPMGADVVDVVEGSERFTWSFTLYGGEAAGGDVALYRYIVRGL